MKTDHLKNEDGKGRFGARSIFIFETTLIYHAHRSKRAARKMGFEARIARPALASREMAVSVLFKAERHLQIRLRCQP